MKHISLLLGVGSLILTPLASLFSQNNSGNSPFPNLKIEAKGTGQTTGHIADLSVKNNEDEPINTFGQTVYIPSDGKYQPYIGYIPPATFPPGATITIPVNGYCADVTTPPVPTGNPMPPATSWIPVQNPLTPVPEGSFPIIPVTPVTPFSPSDIPGITEGPGWKPFPDVTEAEIIVNWPGTDTPFDGTMDPVNYPKIFAPVIVKAIERIEVAADSLLKNHILTTPFSGQPEKEREAVIQQSFWIFMGGATGKRYTKETFGQNVIEQFEKNAGMLVTTLPQEQKEKLDDGVEAFWNVFTAVGVEAKVLSANAKTNSSEKQTVVPAGKTNVPPVEIVSGCKLKKEETDTGEKLDYKIAKTGTEEANQKVKEAFEAVIREAAGMQAKGEKSDTVDVGFTTPEMPASAWSLYFPHIVGGRANGTAFGVNLKDPPKSAWTTEPIDTKAEGEHTYVFTHELSPGCTSTFIGVNIAKVKASSGMDATMGNVDALKVVNFVGEIAIDIVLKKGKGTYKKLGKYLKEKTKDMAKDKAKEFIKNELDKASSKIKDMTDEEAEKTMDDLIKDIKAGPKDDVDPEEWLNDWVADQMIEGKDFDPVEKLEGDLIDNFDSPIDWAPIKTNTYAITEGSLDIWVEGDHGVAKAASGVRYKREELEAEEEAVKGGGVICDEGIASAISSGKITLKTLAKTSNAAGATGGGMISTGHGQATATLESFNGIWIFSLCECPDDVTFDNFYRAYSYNAGTTTSPGINKSIFKNIMTDAVNEISKGMKEAAKNEGALPDNFKDETRKKLANAAIKAMQLILPCDEKK